MTFPTRTPLSRALRWHHGVWRRWLSTTVLALGAGTAAAAPPPDRLTLLVPDTADLTTWQVKVWVDSAADEGIRLDVITDTALLAMGSGAAARIAGLVVPDSAHLRATDAVVAAIKQYAYLGGKLMLVYDAGVLDDAGAFPAIGNSRFADAAGVDYALWNNGAGAATMVGFGPVVGTLARMDALSLPPGKYLPYAPPPGAAAPVAAPAPSAKVGTTSATTFAAAAQASPTAPAALASFVPASASDPSGMTAMASTLEKRSRGIDDGSSDVRAHRGYSLRKLLGLSVETSPAVRTGPRNAAATRALDLLVRDQVTRPPDALAARFNAATGTVTELNPGTTVHNATTGTTGGTATTGTTTTAKAAAPTAALAIAVPTLPALPADSTLQTISSYGYGSINYYQYVTTGAYDGTAWLSSPDHGLVAGTRTYGSGQVLFVNLPLGYFKALGTDSAPIQGFLNAFARDQVGIASMSVQPRGKGGLVYNWHVDDGNDLTSDTLALLNTTTVLNRGPFSIHFTAGPDVINFGDGLGMNLPGNPTAQALVRRLGNIGVNRAVLPAHELGSHGGWIHDYWGANAKESNIPDLTSLLQQNFDAITRTTGRAIREYSSPVGNTPTWAVRWLEARGVTAMYLTGDIGSAAVRSWRSGARLANKLWSFPVTPLGPYATFEEFDFNGITDTVSGQWLLDLQSFAVNHRTHRLFYNHPPGALGHLTPLNALLARADTLQAQGSFAWYTMANLAEFSQRRVETTWTTSVAGTTMTFNASHPVSLTNQTWLLPKLRYGQPSVRSGRATVTGDATNWVVAADSGNSLRFTATLR